MGHQSQSVGSGLKHDERENPRWAYVIGRKPQLTMIVRGSSRRISCMLASPASGRSTNNRVMNRRRNCSDRYPPPATRRNAMK